MNRDNPQDRRWQVVAFLFAAFALCYVDRQAAFSIFPVLEKELGFSSAELGLVGSLFVWSYALTMPLAGRIADVFRRDRLLIISLVLWSLSTLGTALSGSVATFLGWRVMMGLTESLYFPAAMAILATLHPGPTRSRALSIHQSAQLLGIVAGGWYGGWAADQIGWRNGFAALCFVGIAYSLVLLFFFRKIPVTRTVARSVSEGSRKLLHSPLYLLLAATFFCFCGVLWIVYAWLPDLLYEHFGLSLSASGFNATLYVQVGCGLGTLLGGWLADHFVPQVRAARFYTVACGVILSMPCVYLAFRAPSLTQFRVFATGFGLLSGLAIGNWFAAAYDVVRDQDYGFATGVLNMTGGVSAGMAMLMAGVYKSTLGLAGIMAWASILAVISGITLLVGARLHFGSSRRFQ
jgi:predicted MFS family arabinose efflux permease